MKRILIGLFYTLQGIGNLVFAIGAFTSDPKFGIGIGFFLLVPSIFSFITVWKLFQRKIDQTRAWGIVVSIFFILFYGIFVNDSYSSIVRGMYVYHYFVLLMISLLIIVLNVVAVLCLFSIVKNKHVQD
jgi:hypothetical protein